MLSYFSPMDVAVMHFHGHQKKTPHRLEEIGWLMRPPNGQPRTKRRNPHENIDPDWRSCDWPRLPTYTEAEKTTSWSRGSHQNQEKKRRWWEPPGGKLLVPKGMVLSLVSQVHCMTHLGHFDKLKNLIWRYFLVPRLSSLIRKEFQNYNAWSQINPAPGYRPKPTGIQLKATLPFEYLEVDFIEMKYYHHFITCWSCYVHSCDGWRSFPP